VQKREANSDKMTVQIKDDDEVLAEQSTSAEYGVVTVSQSVGFSIPSDQSKYQTNRRLRRSHTHGELLMIINSSLG
jgi:hypothetical protein